MGLVNNFKDIFLELRMALDKHRALLMKKKIKALAISSGLLMSLPFVIRVLDCLLLVLCVKSVEKNVIQK